MNTRSLVSSCVVVFECSGPFQASLEVVRCNATELNVGACVAVRAAMGGFSYDTGLLVVAVPDSFLFGFSREVHKHRDGVCTYVCLIWDRVKLVYKLGSEGWKMKWVVFVLLSMQYISSF